MVLRDPGPSTFDSPGPTRKAIAVPTARLAALRNAIVSERFFKLRKEYGDFIVDGPEMRIRVQLGAMTHQVILGSIKPKMSKRESDEVDRFMRVWFEARDCLPAALRSE